MQDGCENRLPFITENMAFICDSYNITCAINCTQLESKTKHLRYHKQNCFLVTGKDCASQAGLVYVLLSGGGHCSHPTLGFCGGSDGKETASNEGDAASIPGSGGSPGGGNGNLLQYCRLENPMDRGAWQATVPVVAKSQT